MCSFICSWLVFQNIAPNEKRSEVKRDDSSHKMMALIEAMLVKVTGMLTTQSYIPNFPTHLEPVLFEYFRK